MPLALKCTGTLSVAQIAQACWPAEQLRHSVTTVITPLCPYSLLPPLPFEQFHRSAVTPLPDRPLCIRGICYWRSSVSIPSSASPSRPRTVIVSAHHHLYALGVDLLLAMQHILRSILRSARLWATCPSNYPSRRAASRILRGAKGLSP